MRALVGTVTLVLAAAPGLPVLAALIEVTFPAADGGVVSADLYRGGSQAGSARGVPRLVAIRQQYERAPDPKELIVLDGTAQAPFLFATDQGDQLLRETIRFLSAP